MSLSEATKLFLQQITACGAPTMRSTPLPQARAQMAQLSSLCGVPPRNVTTDDHEIPVPGGTVPARAYYPESRAVALIVYFHGGGWVLGGIAESDGFVRIAANAISSIIVSIGYRLAPEHRFPTAADDGYAAMAWIEAHASEIKAEGLPLVVFGESAGGGIAAAGCLRAVKEGRPKIVGQILCYPVVSADFNRQSYVTYAEGYLLSTSDMRWFWDQYVPDVKQRTDWKAAPLLAEDLAGLPPTLLLSAEFDPLRDEGEAYARRLADAGVDVELVRIPGSIHGFMSLMGVLEEGRLALDAIANKVRQLAVGAGV